MPVSWIHDMSKQQLQELASQLGLSVDGKLYDLRVRMKEKWTAIEAHLPSHRTDMSDFPNSHPAADYDSSHLGKMKLKLVTDLIKNVPVVEDADLERVLNFLIRAKEAYDLHLVTDCEFISLLLSRTPGRITQILGVYLGTTRTGALFVQRLYQPSSLLESERSY
jgi:hypothetical protein